MRHLILAALLRACRLLLAPTGRRRAPGAAPAHTTPPAPAWADCSRNQPVPAHLLALTIPLPPTRLIPPYLELWEALPENEKEAQRRARVREAWPQWVKIQRAELNRRVVRAQERKGQPSLVAARRACAFAATLNLPDPLHYLDDATNDARELVGAVSR
ncbi:hypothetical protein [Kitasatospora sp. NPDC088779]|uniref:hypothetical protein n=1 Tax=Kitasatospora sp. NPDC088779 TaxID=3154964 RepID=UPI0034492EEB